MSYHLVMPWRSTSLKQLFTQDKGKQARGVSVRSSCPVSTVWSLPNLTFCQITFLFPTCAMGSVDTVFCALKNELNEVNWCERVRWRRGHSGRINASCMNIYCGIQSTTQIQTVRDISNVPLFIWALMRANSNQNHIIYKLSFIFLFFNAYFNFRSQFLRTEIFSFYNITTLFQVHNFFKLAAGLRTFVLFFKDEGRAIMFFFACVCVCSFVC